MVDNDGDGFRELSNGEKITLNIQFANQGIPLQVVELVANDRSEVGVKTTVKEVTPDEYRSAQSANLLDVGAWGQSAPPVITLGANERWVPPSSAYFGHRTGMLWAEWVESGGAAGAEPPDYVIQLIDDINAFQSAPIGSGEFKTLGQRMVKNMTENLLFIGTVLGPLPIYHRNALKNFVEFRTQSYSYYRTCPYRATQWYFGE